MNITGNARTITAVRATGPSSLHLSWSEGTAADLDLGAVLADRAFAALRDPGEFAKVEVGDRGHSLAWPSGAVLGADMRWLETLSATGCSAERCVGKECGIKCSTVWSPYL